MAKTPAHCPDCGAEPDLDETGESGRAVCGRLFYRYPRITGDWKWIQGQYLCCTERQLDTAKATIKRLKEAMPPPERLLSLADWFDLYDERTGNIYHSSIQRDLRDWAAKIKEAP